MANTFVPIQSVTLTGSQTSVVFSSIPQTYTDLMVRYTIRADISNDQTDVFMTFNGVGGTSYSSRILYCSSTSAVPSFQTGTASVYAGIVSAATATANTFGVGEIYIPNYTGSTSKPFSAFGTPEYNKAFSGGSQALESVAGLWSNSAAITSITLATNSGSVNWVAGSSFHLYGIKNA